MIRKVQDKQVPTSPVKNRTSFFQSNVVLPKLQINPPNDKYEKEADAMAEKVMRMPEGESIQRKCSDCEDNESIIQRKELSKTKIADTNVGSGTHLSTTFHHELSRSKGSGSPLSSKTNEAMSMAFNSNFDNVRIHTDNRAIAMSEHIQAKAFTQGNEIYFNKNQYAPSTESGKKLLAHELTHVQQQNGQNTNNFKQKNSSGKKVNGIQRKLKVDDTVPSDPNEPAHTLSQNAFRTQAFSQANDLVQGLCNQFQVNQGTGMVEPVSKTFCNDTDEVANRANNQLGCCCLCTIADPGANLWTIRMTEIEGPHTNPGNNTVVVHPINSVFNFGHWTANDPATGGERTVISNQIVIFGHELCGHATLLELKAHAPHVSRLESNVHDSTVRVQNAIANEQGVSVNDDRGLAAQGVHRGESLTMVTLDNFPFNASNTSQLPAAQQRTLARVAAFANVNNFWIDILGHSDTVGSADAKLSVSQQRAKAARQFLLDQGISNTISSHGLTNVDRFTRVEGRSDFDLLPGAVIGSPDPNLRRVDIILVNFPAGAQNPVGATPTTIRQVDPEHPARVAALKNHGNACEQLLVGTAWP